MNYATEFWSYSAPQGYLYVQGWYSPTGSFLQIQPKNEKLACGSTATFKVQYTTSIALDAEIKYKVNITVISIKEMMLDHSSKSFPVPHR